MDFTFDFLHGNLNGYSLPLSIVYTYTDAQFQSSFNSDFDGWGSGVEKGDQLPYIAQNQLAINASLECKSLDFTFSSKYVGEMRTTAGKGDVAQQNRIDAQLVIDLSANVHLTKQLSLFTAARNITNQIYLVSRRPAGLRPGMPRNFQLGVKAIF